MALNFLSLLPGLISAGGGLLAAKKNKTGITPGDASQARIAGNLESLSRSLVESNNPMMNRIAADEEIAQRDIFQKNLRDLLNANNRARLMGRATVFDPERQDESINKLLTVANTEIPRAARQSAIERIMNAANAYSAAGGAAQIQGTNERNRRMATADKMGAITKGVSGLAGIANNYFNPTIDPSFINMGATDPGLPWLTL